MQFQKCDVILHQYTEYEELYQILEKIHLKINYNLTKKGYNIKEIKSYRLIVKYYYHYKKEESIIRYKIINTRDRDVFIEKLRSPKDLIGEYCMFTPSLLHQFIKDIWGQKKSKFGNFFTKSEFETIHNYVLGCDGVFYEPSTDPNDLNINKVKALNYLYNELEKL